MSIKIEKISCVIQDYTERELLNDDLFNKPNINSVDMKQSVFGKMQRYALQIRNRYRFIIPAHSHMTTTSDVCEYQPGRLTAPSFVQHS